MSDIYTIIQKAIDNIPQKDFTILLSEAFYSNNGISGIKLNIEYQGVVYPAFTGFSNEKKYSEKLLFGILKSDTSGNLKFLDYPKDENDNYVQDTFKVDNKFFKLDEATQIKKMTKWLRDETKGFVIVNSIYNTDESFIDYSNLSSSQWFKIVELPWLITLLSIISVCFCIRIQKTNVKAMYALLIISSILFLIGLISIFVTIGKKKKIREAHNLPITQNPYTWFISKIGKTICGTSLITIGAGILLILSIIIKIISSSISEASNSSKSIRTSNSNSSTASSQSATSLYSTSSNNSSTTSNSNSHDNTTKTSKSIIYFYCKYCGYSALSISNLTGGFCSRHPNGTNKGHHSPYQGTVREKYLCKYCGYSALSISNLTGVFCPRHPNGVNKGHHSPQI